MIECPCCLKLALHQLTDPEIGRYARCAFCGFFSMTRPAAKNDRNKTVITDFNRIGTIVYFANNSNFVMVRIDKRLEQVDIKSLRVLEEA